MSETAYFEALSLFFSRPVAQKATGPIKNGGRIAIRVGTDPGFTLSKRDGKAEMENKPAENPDITFWVPPKSIEKLTALETEDIGEIGVAILRLMAEADPEFRISAKLHIGVFELFLKGYLGVLPLGGATVTKFLATKGLTGMGKIKDAMANLREKR